tara:strand:+ start:41866 stop:42138 length:273 start_codon:yes stop_codon:yes gene_type:complete
MNIITKGEYIKALILIDEYHQQNKQTEIKGITLDEIIHLHDISGRLKNVLNQLAMCGVNYIHEIHEYNFKRIRNAGDISWKEFEKIKLNN